MVEKKIKVKTKNECECYMVGNKIVCFLVGRFMYLGKPSDKKLSLPDDCRTISNARDMAHQTCKEYIQAEILSNSI